MNHERSESRAAKASGLRYVHDDVPGITRLRQGRHFRYKTSRGHILVSARSLQRIQALAIPPAWTDVWICPIANGHLQATGRDAKGRKQYRYHPEWNAQRTTGKFEHVVAFAESLPRLRQAVRAALKTNGFPREKVIALVVAVLADTLIRVGNAQYAKENHSFGLTTLRNRHIEFVRGGRARFKFKGKSAQSHDVILNDKRLVKLIRSCQQLPGQSLFQYIDESGQRVPVRSDDVNDWLHEVMGESFTAKDFRTWAATHLAFRLFAETERPLGKDGKPATDRALSEVENAVVADVANALGNTVSVCRKAYIDPVVPEGWRSGALAGISARTRTGRQWEKRTIAYLKRSKRRART